MKQHVMGFIKKAAKFLGLYKEPVIKQTVDSGVAWDYISEINHRTWYNGIKSCTHGKDPYGMHSYEKDMDRRANKENVRSDGFYRCTIRT